MQQGWLNINAEEINKLGDVERNFNAFDWFAATLEEEKQVFVHKYAENVTTHIYVSELIGNQDGQYDDFGSAWLAVPKYWAEEQVKKQGFEDLNDFNINFTCDDTLDWIRLAMKEGILMGCGVGVHEEDEE